MNFKKLHNKILVPKSENGKKQWCDIEVIYRTLYKLNFQSNWKFVIMTHHNTKLQLGGRKNIYKNIYADTTSKFASIRLLARWSGSVYKLMIHHWLLWFFVYVIIRYISWLNCTKYTHYCFIRNVLIRNSTQILSNI